MALVQEIGAFTVRSGIGTQTVTLVNAALTPLAFIFWGEKFGGTDAAGAFALGFDDGTNHMGTACAAGDFARAYDDPQGVWSDEASIVRCRTSFAFEIKLVGYVQSIAAGSFVVNFTVNDATSCVVNYLAIGGSGIQALVGRVNYAASGDVVLPFRPVALALQHQGGASGTQTAPSASFSYGFLAQCGSDVQTAVANHLGATANPSNTFGAQKTGSLLSVSTLAITGLLSATTTSAGFSYTWTGGASGYFAYLALGGALAANAGTLTQAASSISISASSPKVVLFGSNCRTHSTTGSADAFAMFGAANSTSQRCVWFADPDNIAPPSWAQSTLDTTHAIVLRTPTGDQVNTLSGRASVTSLTSGSIALNWDTSDGTAREVFYLVLADDVGSGVCGATVTGGIVVAKHTSIASGASFDFTTTGGLSPSTFSLSDGGARTFSSLSAGTYGISETPIPGWTASYSVSNANPHTAIVISGNVVTVDVTNTFGSTTQQLRRYRRFNLPWSDNYNMIFKRAELIAQMGVGTSILDPTVTLRFSKDGGQTYPITRTVTLGLQGDYTKRAYTLALGEARNWVCEVYCDDPVFCGWIGFDVDMEKGIS